MKFRPQSEILKHPFFTVVRTTRPNTASSQTFSQRDKNRICCHFLRGRQRKIQTPGWKEHLGVSPVKQETSHYEAGQCNPVWIVYSVVYTHTHTLKWHVAVVTSYTTIFNKYTMYKLSRTLQSLAFVCYSGRCRLFRERFTSPGASIIICLKNNNKHTQKKKKQKNTWFVWKTFTYIHTHTIVYNIAWQSWSAISREWKLPSEREQWRLRSSAAGSEAKNLLLLLASLSSSAPGESQE